VATASDPDHSLSPHLADPLHLLNRALLTRLQHKQLFVADKDDPIRLHPRERHRGRRLAPYVMYELRFDTLVGL